MFEFIQRHESAVFAVYLTPYFTSDMLLQSHSYSLEIDRFRAAPFVTKLREMLLLLRLDGTICCSISVVRRVNSFIKMPRHLKFSKTRLKACLTASATIILGLC